jgi:hypothetical protein
MSKNMAAEIEQDATEEAQSLVRQVAWRVLVALSGLIAHEAAVLMWRQVTGGPPPRRRARDG